MRLTMVHHSAHLHIMLGSASYGKVCLMVNKANFQLKNDIKIIGNNKFNQKNFTGPVLPRPTVPISIWPSCWTPSRSWRGSSTGRR